MHQILAINTDFAVVVQLFKMVKKVCNIKMISSYNCLKKGPTIKFRKWAPGLIFLKGRTYHRKEIYISKWA